MAFSKSVLNSIFELILPLVYYSPFHSPPCLPRKPPPPTTISSTHQEAQATGQATIIELPPSPPPRLMSLQVDSNEAQPTDLATVIMLLTKSLSSLKKSSTWTNVHKLDIFNGSDTCKLKPFLVQCTLNFYNHPDVFASDSDKVTFALSYLKGSDFVGELKNNFGPHDPKGEAEADLKNLCMYDNQCIVKYLVNLNHLTAHVQWGDATLHRQLYHRLPSCIKDEIAHVGKPDTLHELHSLAQSINS